MKLISDREMYMEKGELLGKGMTAEVYKWGQDKVLKLYYGKFGDEWVKREALIGQKIHDAGVPSPAVYDTVEIDRRQGIIFERVHGKTMTGMLVTQPWKFYGFLLQTAGLHHKIHKYSTDGIPSQKERFERTIALSSHILGKKVKKILDYVDRLPEGNSICHGDMYLSNIMISGKNLVAIDWSSGYRGDPAGDVARTYLIINTRAVLPGIPSVVTAMSAYPKWMSCRTYLDEYMRISNIKYENIDAWMLPVAAAKLKDRIPGEEKWLMKIINKRLEQLETQT